MVRGCLSATWDHDPLPLVCLQSQPPLRTKENMEENKLSGIQQLWRRSSRSGEAHHQDTRTPGPNHERVHMDGGAVWWELG